MEHFQEAKAIWTQFVPRSGQAEIVQGELLRAVEKLRDGAVRNGKANWEQGFEILLAYLGNHLLDPAVFAADAMGQTEAILARLRDHAEPLLDDKCYDALSDRIVEYYRTDGSQLHARTPAPPLTGRASSCHLPVAKAFAAGSRPAGA